MSNGNLEFASDVAFTPSVKAIQTRKGSRRAYSRMEEGGSWQTEIPKEIAAFIESRTSIFLATANAAGQPYIQHRGGPAGFLKVLDRKTIGFADFAGNRQYISQGNLAENPRAHLFLMDYMHQRRLKIWGTAKVVEDDNTLVQKLMPADYAARGEQAILFEVHAWDMNCPQHIPQMIDAEIVRVAIEERDRRIAELERDLEKARHTSRT